MLVLTRKQSQLIQIGDNIVIKVIRTGAGTVKLGIDAPHDVRVMRGELDDLLTRHYEEQEAEQRAPKKPSSPSASETESLAPSSRRAEQKDEEEVVSHVSRKKQRNCVA